MLQNTRIQKLESMRNINKRLASFFCEELEKDNVGAKAAKNYMLSRWEEEFYYVKHIVM